MCVCVFAFLSRAYTVQMKMRRKKLKNTKEKYLI